MNEKNEESVKAIRDMISAKIEGIVPGETANNLIEAGMDPDAYFNKVKKSIQTQTTENLDALLTCTRDLLKNAHATGQTGLVTQLVINLDAVRREKVALANGLNQFLFKEAILEYVEKVDKRVVKFIELPRYPRPIPVDVVAKIAKAKELKLFDEYYVLFTDYTNKVAKQVKQEERKKDPIVFGCYRTSTYTVERFYFIADWVDEHCDLTLGTLLKEMSDLYGIKHPDGTSPLRTAHSSSEKDLNDIVLVEMAKINLAREMESRRFLTPEEVEMRKLETAKPGLLRKFLDMFK